MRSFSSGTLAALLLTGVLAFPAPAQDDAEVAEGRVEAELDRGSDREIEERLRATYSTLDVLRGVDVEVEAGIVRLDGTVDSVHARDLAMQLARQIEGVAAVRDGLEETRSVRRRLGLALDRLADRVWELIDGLPVLVLALLVVLASVLLAQAVGRWDAPYRVMVRNPFLRDLARQAVRALVVLAGVVLALEILDATALVGAVLGAAGVAGLAVGFAFRDLVENYIASILLSLRRPFAPNDLVRIEGHEGRIARLTSRATVLVTLDGNHVRIPNGVVFKATIENFTRNPQRRFSFGVGVGVQEDLVAAQDLGVGILRSMEGVIGDPPPTSAVEALGDSSVTLQFFGWVDQREADFLKVRSEAIRLVKQAFDRQGIEMPEPIHRVRLETLEAPAGDSTPAPRAEEEGQRDISPDRHVDRLVDEERAESEPDLLSEAAPVE